MDFVHIFGWSHPSQLRAFVHFENSSLPRIWKRSDLVFIFNILFSFTFNEMMVTEVKRSHELASCYHIIPVGCKQPTAIITPTIYNAQ